jgi:hypothetical protein
MPPTTTTTTISTPVSRSAQIWNQPVPQSVHDHPTPDSVLTAYLETVDFTEWEIQPLLLRANAVASKLQKVTYPAVHSCTTLPKHFPVDNTPVEMDTFLPWIHDIFPTADGKYIQIVAQNKRRCHTGKNDGDLMTHRQPQVALLQHVACEMVLR